MPRPGRPAVPKVQGRFECGVGTLLCRRYAREEADPGAVYL